MSVEWDGQYRYTYSTMYQFNISSALNMIWLPFYKPFCPVSTDYLLTHTLGIDRPPLVRVEDA